MTDGLMDLQTELTTVEDQVERTFRTMISAVQAHRLFRNARRMLQHVDLFDQFVSLELVLSPERIRVGAPLNLVVAITQSGTPGSGRRAGLIDPTAGRGGEELPLPRQDHRSFRERDAFVPPDLAVDR